MKWLKRWTGKGTKEKGFDVSEVLPGAKSESFEVMPVTDKQLDAILEAAKVSRREIYDVWLKEKKGAAFPNDPTEVLAYAKEVGLL